MLRKSAPVSQIPPAIRLTQPHDLCHTPRPVRPPAGAPSQRTAKTRRFSVMMPELRPQCTVHPPAILGLHKGVKQSRQIEAKTPRKCCSLRHLPDQHGFFAVFDGNPHPAWDTTEDESPLSSRPVVFRPYILHGAYWYGSGYSRGNRCRARTFGGGWLAPGIACMRPSALGLWPVSGRLLSPPGPARFP